MPHTSPRGPSLAWSLPLALVVLGMLPFTAAAQNPQYRKLTLTDGRQIRAEVLATEATGLRMRIPQGDTLVSFEVLMDMVPIDQIEYRDQPPVKVWVHSPTVAEELRRIFGAVPNLAVVTPEDPKGLAPELVTQLAACNEDFECMSELLATKDWMWLVTGLAPGDASDPSMVVRARTSLSPPIHKETAASVQIPDLWVAAHESIQLVPPGTVPKSVLVNSTGDLPPPPPKPWTLERASKLTPGRLFVPGLASFQQGDSKRGLMGMGIAVAGTGVVAGTLAATSLSSEDKGAGGPLQIGVLSAATWIGLAAFTNSWLGPVTYTDPSVSLHVAPRPGGAQVGVHGRL